MAQCEARRRRELDEALNREAVSGREERGGGRGRGRQRHMAQCEERRRRELDEALNREAVSGRGERERESVERGELGSIQEPLTNSSRNTLVYRELPCRMANRVTSPNFTRRRRVRVQEVARLATLEYVEQRRRDLELHDELRAEQAHLRYRKHYDMCCEVLADIVNVTTRVTEYRGLTGK